VLLKKQGSLEGIHTEERRELVITYRALVFARIVTEFVAAAAAATGAATGVGNYARDQS